MSGQANSPVPQQQSVADNDRESPFALTGPQMAIWLDQALHPNEPIYNTGGMGLSLICVALSAVSMLNLLLAAMFFTGMQHCLRSFFTVYLVETLGLSLSVAGAAFAASQAAGIAGQIGWAMISDRVLAHAR